MDLFNESLIVPSNLRFFLHRLADDAQPSTNILKINAMNSTSASSGGLITVRLPMALVDLNSFAMFFQTSMTDGATAGFGGANVAQGILPKGIEGLISRMEVSVNGLGLLNLQQYNLLYDTLKNSHMDMDKSVMRRTLQNECDTSPILEIAGADTASIGQQSIFVSSVYAIASSGITNLKLTCNLSCVQDNVVVGQTVGSSNLTQLGISYASITSATISAVRNVPSYVQTTSQSGTTQYILGGLVTQIDITYVGTTISIANIISLPTTSPQYSFSLTAGGYGFSGGNAVAAPTVPLSGVVTSKATTAPFAPASGSFYLANQNSYHCISDWLAFFKAQPNWIQLQMLGEVEIRLTLAGQEVLSVPPDLSLTTRPDYALSNIFFTVRTCSFDNNFYDDILSEKLSSGGEIEIPYSNYYNINQVQSAGSSSTRFSVNTQCLNKIVSVNRPSYYNSTAGAMVHVPCGYGIRADGGYGVVNKGAFFQTTSGIEPFTSSAVSGVNQWQYQINNSFVPNVKIDPSFAFYNHLEAWNLHNSWSDAVISGAQTIFLNANYQMAIALDFMDSSIPRLCSGIDTRGAVSVAYLLQDDNNAGDRTDIFTCFTSVLKVGANQQIQVIY